MSSLKVLIVDDDEVWTETFLENLSTVSPAELAGKDYGQLVVRHETNQDDANRAVSEAGPAGFDLVLLDLRYPEKSGGPLSEDIEAGYQGMKWLPELRRLQPKAAIVILTAHAHEHELRDTVAAIRDHHASEFVPKTVPLDHVVGRIRLACEHARQRQKLLMLEKELRSLGRTRVARTYAEDVATLLNNIKVPMDRIAQRIETGDPSAAAEAPEAIRGEFRSAMNEFSKLTEMMDKRVSLGGRRREAIDVVECVRSILLLYEIWIEEAMATVIGPSEEQSVTVTTYAGDLKVALHEIITNAIESLEKCERSVGERTLRVEVEKGEEDVIIRVLDNGDRFSDAAIQHMFQLGFSTQEDEQHQGMGLYIARRMMHAIGGEISARNIKGGVEVELTVRNLA